MTECREHHFESSGRCAICSMQARYYCEAMTILHSMPKDIREAPNEHWQEKVDSYKCKFHFHDPHHGILTKEEHLAIHDPLLKLYDMEQ